MKLSAKQQEELQQAMLSAFPEPQRLKEMLKVKLVKNLASYSSPSNTLDIIISDLIARAESEGWLQELVNKAHEHNPGNPQLKLFVQSFKEENARPDIPCPYRGLSAFREEDKDLFFGREKFVQQLVEAVKEHPLVPVIGASGSGKSSVVLAGLIPRLRAEGTWLIESFRPQSQPFYGLASALVRVHYPELNKNKRDEQISNLFERMQGNRKLWQEITDILKKNPGKRLLLVIDQFEELYAFNTKDQQKLVTKDQQKIVDALLEAIKENPRLKLVLTIRTDFLDYIINYPSFKEVALKQDTPQYLGQMNEQEIKSVIEVTDDHRTEKIVRLEDGLTDTILNDVKQEPGNLPLLEFALTQLWEENQGGILTHQAYQKIGGVRKALANHADAIYHNLDEKEKKQLQQIFVRLARLGEKRDVAEEEKRQTQQSFVATDTRQLATRSEIGKDNWRLVRKLAGVDPDIPDREKKLPLLVTGWDEKTEESTVEVVHEALIREWERLQKWIDDDRTFLTWQNRLRISIAEWNKGEGKLLQDKPLVIAEDWLQNREADLTDEQQKYIRQSLALREKEIKERESQQKRNTVIQTTAICLGIVGIILIVLLNRTHIIKAWIICQKKHLAERNLANYYLPGIDLSTANLSKANLSESHLVKANLSGANLQGANLVKTFIQGADFSKADLSKADLLESNLQEANLSGANFQGASLVKTFIQGADFSKADLSKADLLKSNLQEANLSGANFQGASLVKTHMVQAHLQETNLSQADLSEANMDGADLSGANFQGAKNLNPDQVMRAKNWEKAKYDEDFRKKLNLKGSNCNCPIVPIAPLDETSK